MWNKLSPFSDPRCCTDQLAVISGPLQWLSVYTRLQMHAEYAMTVSQLYHGSDSIFLPLSNFKCTSRFATEAESRKRKEKRGQCVSDPQSAVVLWRRSTEKCRTAIFSALN